MSIRHPVPRTELGTKYSHYGLLFGLLPVYVGEAESGAPLVVERNWVPSICFDATEALIDLVEFVAQLLLLGRDEPRHFFLWIGERIKPAGPDAMEP